MRKLLVLMLAMVFVMTACVPALADDITLTVGKEFDYNGKTILEGQDLDNNYYLDYIYQKHGIKFEYSWILDDDEQKISLAVASGSMPDVMLVDLSTFNMLIESDMIQPLTAVFEEHANQYLLDARDCYPESFAAATVNGELMAIPNTTVKKQHQYIWVRQDWLDNLGLEVPTTLEEVVEVARAFVENDPDGNGEDDTIGFTLSEDIIGTFGADYVANPIAGVFKSYARMWYQQEDGTVVYGSTTQGTRDTLEYLANMYSEGLIDKQFAVRDQAELVVSGKCGIFFGSWCAGPLRQSYGYDQADWIPVAAPLDENGKFNTTNPVPADTYVVVSKNCAHPEAVIQTIGAEYEFHRYLTGDDEQTALMDSYNTAGVSWTMMPIAIQIEATDIVAERGKDMVQMIDTGDRTGVSKENQSFYDAYLEFLDDPTSLTGWVRYKGMYLGCNVANSDANTYVSPCFWGMTETMEDMWTSLKTMEDEVFMKIVMGEEDITAFDDFVKQWNEQGGEQITREVQEYVDSRS